MRREKDSPQVQEVNFWLSEFKKRQPLVTAEQKVRLFVEFFRIFCDLTDNELGVFIAPEINRKDPVFIQAAEKVGDFWASSFPGYKSLEIQEKYKETRELFKEKAVEVLVGVYSHEDLTRIFSPMKLGEEAYVMRLILGEDHYLWRRIRDAYLPKITDLLLVQSTPLGTEVTDLTDRLFLEGTNPSDQMDKFIKGNLPIYTGSIN